MLGEWKGVLSRPSAWPPAELPPPPLFRLEISLNLPIWDFRGKQRMNGRMNWMNVVIVLQFWGSIWWGRGGPFNLEGGRKCAEGSGEGGTVDQRWMGQFWRNKSANLWPKGAHFYGNCCKNGREGRRMEEEEVISKSEGSGRRLDDQNPSISIKNWSGWLH